MSWFMCLSVKEEPAGSIPAPGAALVEGQANGRWQPPRTRPSDEPWGFDSHSFRLQAAGLVQWHDSWPNQATGVRLPDPAFGTMYDASLAERSGAGFPGPTGGFDSRGALSGIG